MSLRQKIEEEIRRQGPLPFSRYMEICLYDPKLGYYAAHAEQFGKTGDFYTSSDVHAVFGRLLARQFDEMWRALGSPASLQLVELGPGRGLFAQDVLDWAEKKFPEFYGAQRYTLDERSPALRERLEARFREHMESGRVALLPNMGARALTIGSTGQEPAGEDARRRASAPEVPLILFANEFFDALPVEVLSEKGSLRISAENDRFTEEWAASPAAELEFLDRYGVHPTREDRTEAALVGQRYMREIAASLQRGFLIAIDYGYTRDEQLAGRHLGTVMTYRQHSVSPNPYEAPGEQDITAHVNFTALAAAAEENGVQVEEVRTQSQFLMGIGEANQFADAFEECRLPQERAKVALQLKHLVTPAGMGETFHVMVGSKGVEREVVAKLSGLSFGR